MMLSMVCLLRLFRDLSCEFGKRAKGGTWCFNDNLTHWGRDKMTAKFLMTISNAFSWMKIYKFGLRFHWNLFPRVQLTIFGTKPLSEPVMVSLLTHICATHATLKIIHFKAYSAYCWPFCSGLHVLLDTLPCNASIDFMACQLIWPLTCIKAPRDFTIKQYYIPLHFPLPFHTSAS